MDNRKKGKMGKTRKEGIKIKREEYDNEEKGKGRKGEKGEEKS